MRLRPRVSELSRNQLSVYKSFEKAVRLYISDTGTQPTQLFAAPNIFDTFEAIFNTLLTPEDLKIPIHDIEIMGISILYDLSLAKNMVRMYPATKFKHDRSKIKYFQFPLVN